MEEINEDIQSTPPEIQKKSLETSLEILPKKSIDKYTRQYDLFMEWCKKHEVKKYSENVLLAYFYDLSKEYSPSSMWSYYSMVKATLSAKNNIDISKYNKLTAFLKQKGRTHTPKKSKTLTQEEILKFLLNAPDEIYLMMKVCVVFGIAGALRNEELLNLKVGDIENKETILVIHVNKTKTNRPRLFVVTPEFEGKIKSIELFNKYVALRPKQTPHDRFFVSYRNGKCTVQPVGIHSFGAVPSKIAHYLHLPEPSLYTGHCFRRTSATIFANAGGSKENLKRHGGWKSDTIAESYVEESVLNKMKIAKTILGEQTDNMVAGGSKENVKHHCGWNNNMITGSDSYVQEFVLNKTDIAKTVLSGQSDNIVTNDNSSKDVQIIETPSTSGINFYNATGCTFTFNITNNNI